MSDKSTTITIETGTIIKSILLILLVAFLFYLKDLVLVILTAVVLASAIEPAVHMFTKYKIPRVISVILVYLIILGAFFGLMYLLLPPLVDEASGIIATLPEVIEEIELPYSGFFANDVVSNFSLTEGVTELQSLFSNTSQGLFTSISAIFGGLFSFLIIIVLSFYLAVQNRGVEDFLRVITPLKHESYVVNLWQRSQKKIGLWMQGQVLLSVLITVLVYLGLTLLGLPYALLLAIAAGLFELIPVFGSIMAAVPAIIIAFVDGGASLALFVAGFFIVVNQFQANLIYPLVVKKVVGVPPLLVILALIIGAQLAGFLGIILSVPVAAALQELVADMEKGKRKMSGSNSSTT